jgi:hypothetical protein
MKTQKNEKAEVLKQDINEVLNITNQWFETKEQSHAFIIGYLQGALKSMKITLDYV